MYTKRLRGAVLCAVLGLAVGGAGCGKDAEQAKQEYFASGNALFEQKKYGDAILQYRNALKSDPKFGEARLKLAEAYAQTGDARRAFQEYVRAADLLPGSVEAQVKAGSLYLLAGRYEDAKSRAQQALKADPKSLDAQILLGNATAGTKDLDGAMGELEEAIALAPEESRGYTALGAVQLAKGEIREAEQTFKQAIEVQPESVSARLAYANFLWAANRRPEAQAAFEEAHKRDPENALANRALAGFHMTGRTPEAAEPYLKALAKGPNATAARVSLGEYYLRMNRSAEGKAVLTEAAKEKAGFEKASIRLAALAFTEGKAQDAYRLLDEVLKKNPKQLDALVAKSRMQRAEGRPRDALATVQTATVSAPDFAPAHFERAQAELELHQLDDAVKSLREVIRINPRASRAHMRLADVLLTRGQSKAALTAAEDALRNAPNDPAARLTVARAQMATGNGAGAASALQALQKQYPEAGVVWGQIGALRLMQRDLKGAREAFDRALELQPGQYQAVQGLSLLDVAERKPEAARARVEALLAKHPDNESYLIIAARVYMGQRDFPKAEAALRRVVARDSTHLQAYSLLGQVYLMQNKAEQALNEYETLSRQQPSAVGPHTVIAMLLQNMGRFDEAQKRYERILQLDSQAPVAANNLAWLYAERGGNLDVALQLAQTARRGLPTQPAVADTLGWIYYKKQQYDLAIRELSDAVEKDPDNPEYQYHLGAAYAAKGETGKARAALQKAVAKPFAGIDEARKALESLPT